MQTSLGSILDETSDVARKAFIMREHIIEFQAAISSIG